MGWREDNADINEKIYRIRMRELILRMRMERRELANMEFRSWLMWERYRMELRRERLEMRSPESGKTQPRNNKGQYKKYKTDGSENGGNAADSTRLTSGVGSGIIKSDKQCILDAFTSGNHSDDIVDEIILHHKGFKDIDPAEMKKFLEDNGYNVKPLGGRSALKGIPFEQGGGYRAAFGGDAYFQYHPEEGSDHGGEYWRISNGKRGDNRYDMGGEKTKK